MKRTTQNTVATFRGLMAILIAFVVIATPSTGCAKEKNKNPTTLGNLGSVNIYRIESVVREDENGATITYVTLQANGSWSKELKKSDVPYVQHFKGQYFSGVSAPEGLITLMFFSENDSSACDAALKQRPDKGETVLWIRKALISSN